MRHLLTTCLFALMLCCRITPTAAADATLSQVVTTLEQGYAILQDLQADFQQTTTLAGFPKPQKGHGTLTLRRPKQATAQFRFDYTSPRQSIISNGKQLWFYQPDSKQVLISSLEGMLQGGNSLGMAYLTGLGNVDKDFNAAFVQPKRDQQGNYQLELTPRKPTAALSRLRLTISATAVAAFLDEGSAKEPFPILSSTVHDAVGTESRITYSRIRTNKGLSSVPFNFKVPQGVTIIKP